MLPVLVELVRHQPVERLPGDAARHHVVHQPRQIAGQRQRRGRAADHQRRRHRALRPGRDQVRQRQPALQFAEPRRNVERRRAAELFGAFGKRQFVLVDVAERDDARQDRGVRLQLVEKDFARQPPGAPGRQIERRSREIQRVAARLESIDQPAVDQRGDDGAQERHGDGNAENAHGLPDSRSGANIGSVIGMVMGEARSSPLLTVVTRETVRRVGKAQACPPCSTSRRWWARRERFAHPTRRDDITPRFPETPLPRPGPRRAFRHASRRRRAAGRTAAPARWRGRTSSSAKTRPRARRRTATAT